LIGGSFMVVTMLGMQEARARAPHQATAVIGRMTAAFAIGQLAGPLTLAFAPPGALNAALQGAAAMLALSAAALWRLARRDP
ncbi:MAG: YbfB/YjiJ family MFS transporter, partial [Hyphomicrobiales bacterium]|nr:YbfB/YjiJ family MFS transporter [Hyphomicrobiales bacterium]